MTKRLPVSDLEIAREHRLGRYSGSAADAITNPAMRICLTNLAEMRKKREQPADQPLDGKCRAAGDSE
ncbi:hypothetical protein [Paraburkholderia pallida]|uniref:Uncharacterized protein n=1 Tax=Paraburkholderia pallida TaxID=2547399 RepID=A0A4P7CSV2_9BURK|nr:hypothetical protein [Paraburkholderia pallida]QBQ98187.1 hypothetical protein E1956_14055 [Paraburkholderia pallida]